MEFSFALLQCSNSNPIMVYVLSDSVELFLSGFAAIFCTEWSSCNSCQWPCMGCNHPFFVPEDCSGMDNCVTIICSLHYSGPSSGFLFRVHRDAVWLFALYDIYKLNQCACYWAVQLYCFEIYVFVGESTLQWMVSLTCFSDLIYLLIIA